MRALIVFAAAVGCSSPEPPPVEATDASVGALDVAIDAEWQQRDGCSRPYSEGPYGRGSDGGPDVAPPPAIACVPRETGPCDEPVCELPPSRCVDGAWLVYYANGECIDGTCRYQQRTFYCSSGCSNGGCIYKGTL